MTRKEIKNFNEIKVSLDQSEVARIKKNWPAFKMRPKTLIFYFDLTTRRLKRKNFEDTEIGDMNAALSINELANKIAKL